MTDPNKTAIAIIIDESGSMLNRTADVIGGFTTLIRDQRKLPGTATISLTKFGDVAEVVYTDKPLDAVPLPLVYHPGPSTALYDAIGQTIVSLGKRLEALPEHERPGKVLVLIITDGAENASKEYTGAKVREMITSQTEKYNWTFNFMGCNLDDVFVEQTALGLGIPTANAAAFCSGNSQQAFTRYGGKVSLTRSAMSKGIAPDAGAMSFSSADRDELQDPEKNP